MVATHYILHFFNPLMIFGGKILAQLPNSSTFALLTFCTARYQGVCVYTLRQLHLQFNTS